MCAIRGIDFLNYFDGATWDDNASERAIQWVNEYKGIATIVWHWRVPSEKGGTERAFYVPSASADSTTFSITNALQEGTWEHDVIMADIAENCKAAEKLKDADVPVLWRRSTRQKVHGSGGVQRGQNPASSCIACSTTS